MLVYHSQFGCNDRVQMFLSFPEYLLVYRTVNTKTRGRNIPALLGALLYYYLTDQAQSEQ
jgi:hypothetical protein